MKTQDCSCSIKYYKFGKRLLLRIFENKVDLSYLQLQKRSGLAAYHKYLQGFICKYNIRD